MKKQNLLSKRKVNNFSKDQLKKYEEEIEDSNEENEDEENEYKADDFLVEDEVDEHNEMPVFKLTKIISRLTTDLKLSQKVTQPHLIQIQMITSQEKGSLR